MELHTKNGELKCDYGIFLPQQGLSEYKTTNDSFEIEQVNGGKEMFTNFLPEGEYVKVTATVEVTRYYPVNN